MATIVLLDSAATHCTEKTGTLTLNRMKVTKLFFCQKSIQEGSSSSVPPSLVELIHQGVAFNTTASVYRASEKAILSWSVAELKMDMEKTRKSCVKILGVEHFDSQENCSGVLIGRNIDDTVHVHWKGDAETILAMCSSYYDDSGAVKKLDDDERMRLEQMIQAMAARSLGCTGFAHKQVPEAEYDDPNEKKMLNGNSLILLGLMGIKG